jgi:hypothetical protein
MVYRQRGMVEKVAQQLKVRVIGLYLALSEKDVQP